MSRKEFPVSVRKAALKRCEDAHGVRRCEHKNRETQVRCNAVLTVGKFQFDHDAADGLGGKPTLENCVVTCSPCHSIKTHKHDRPIMQKADNQRAFQDGTKAAPAKKIANRGFPSRDKPRMEKPPALPRRDPFTHQIIEDSR